jgi:Ser/Thr protein kinase RdoA (MazF antagonist)
LTPEYDTLSISELAIVLSHYDLGIVSAIHEFRRGSGHSPKLVITCDRGRFLLKRRAKGKDDPYKVAFAHGVQNYLADRGFPVPRLIGTRYENNSMLQLDDNVYELFDYVQGDRYDGSPGKTLSAGETLALYHHLMADYRSEWEPPAGSYHNAASIRGGLTSVPSTLNGHESVAGKEAEVLGLVQRLGDAYDEAAGQVNDSEFRQWPTVITHCDWHPGNMLFREGKVAAVLDFDTAKLSQRVTDIGNGTLQFSIVAGSDNPRDWPDYFDEPRIKRFLLGYGQHATIDAEEMRLLPALMIEALISEAVLPIAATGSFGRMQGFGFLQMVERKVQWLRDNRERITAILEPV